MGSADATDISDVLSDLSNGMVGRKPKQGMNPDRLLQLFVEHYGRVHGVVLHVTAAPDKLNRSTADIDCLAEGEGGRLAIEHTSVDTLPQQREDNARFSTVLGWVEEELRDAFDARIKVIVNFGSIPTGVDWKMVRDHLAGWLRRHAREIPYGRSEHEIVRAPFKIQVIKRPSKQPGLFVGRFDQKDYTLPHRIRKALIRKSAKLALYGAKGYHGIVLLESRDLALMNLSLMESSVKQALDLGAPEGLSEVWYADASEPFEVQFWRVWAKSFGNGVR